MSSPVIWTEGDVTPNRLWTMDVNLGTTSAPIWQTLQYVSNFAFNPDDANFVDSTVFGDGGYSGQQKTGAAWSATATVSRMSQKGVTPPTYDPVAEFLRGKAIGKFGAANSVQVRIYDFDINDVAGAVTPRVEAYLGFAAVQWPSGDGAQADARTVAIAFMGQGKLNIISHPYPVGPSVPGINSFSGNPLAVAGGSPFRITGGAFTGTTGVTIGGTAVTSFKVWSDGEITGISAAHSAGTGLPVIVTNGTGASATNTLATYA